MAESMTSRERWLAAIRMQPVDRLPFWPKLNGACPRAQAAPFREMGLDAIHDWIGSDRHTWVESCLKEIRKRTSVETTREGGSMTTVFETPHGLVKAFDEPSQSWHPTRFPVRTIDDVFRRHGPPLYSCHIESGIRQTNHRVKGSEKAWLLVHADEMLALRTQALSEDGRWDDCFGRACQPGRRT